MTINEKAFQAALPSLGTPDEFSSHHLDEGELRAFIMSYDAHLNAIEPLGDDDLITDIERVLYAIPEKTIDMRPYADAIIHKLRSRGIIGGGNEM